MGGDEVMHGENVDGAPQLGTATALRVRDFTYATAIIVAATLVGYFWVAPLWPGKLPLMYFAGVLIAGYRLGMWPAMFAAFAAFLAFNYFFEEPRYTLNINAEDVFALVTFLIGGLLVGGLTGRLSDRAREIENALADMTSLFEASRDLSTTVDSDDTVRCVLHHLESNDCRAAIWLVVGGVLTFRAASPGVAAEQIASLERVADSAKDEITQTHVVLRMSPRGRAVGMAAVWRRRKASRPEPRWMRALFDLAAVAFDRARLMGEIAEARVVAEKEGLRTALLSSLSHDLRTPLSTILASATSLLEYEAKFDVATRRDLLLAIQEESERLNRYVGNLLNMTRLESGALEVRRSLIDPCEAMAAALRRMDRQLGGRRVVREFVSDNQRIEVDPVLVEQALVNIIENAVVHSPAESLIRARVETTEMHVSLSIEDDGDGIAAEDMQHLFEKFFRGGDRRRGSGVGLGLAVTCGLIEAFGGSIRAISPTRSGKGTRMEIRLPAHCAMEALE